MARLSDVIEEFIKELFNQSGDSELEIGRNDLATQFNCAPSQITYVLTTRFSTESGYYIESRRGGGGSIKIRKVEFQSNEPLRKLIEQKIGNGITYDSAVKIIDGLLEREILTNREANIMKVAINDRSFIIQADKKNNLRAEILKAMLKIILL